MLLRYQETLSPEEASEPKTGTARTVPCTNCNRTELNRGHPVICRKHLCLTAVILLPMVLLSLTVMGSQHPSPTVKNFPRFQPQIWPEIITSRDAESTYFKGSGRHVMWRFLANFLAGKITSRDGCFLPKWKLFGLSESLWLQGDSSEDSSLLVTFLLVTFSWLFRGFFRGFSVSFSWPSDAPSRENWHKVDLDLAAPNFESKAATKLS